MAVIKKDVQKISEFIAGDDAILSEILHPDKDKVKIHYSLAHARVKPGEITQKHKLKNSEVYYILEGEGIMYVNNESLKVTPNQAVYIPPDSLQYIKNTGPDDLKFLCLVDPAWQPEKEEVYQ